MKKAAKRYITNNEKETIELGMEIGRSFTGNEVVCLSGELGSGKTTFVKGIAKGLGINEDITSPTFILVNEYEGNPALFHFDAYRICDPDEVIEAGFYDYLDRKGIKIIEWADLIEEIMPDDAVRIRITRDTEFEEKRIFNMEYIFNETGDMQ